MKKLLISLTIFFSLFLGVNSVNAEQGTRISPVSRVDDRRYNNYLAKINETGNFLYYNSYHDKKYYFGMGNYYYNSSNRSLFSVETDYPELISIGSKKHSESEDMYEILLNIEYDENKPVYLYYSVGSNSSYNVNIIHSDGTEEKLNNVANSTGLLIKENTSLYLTGFVSPSFTAWESGYNKVEVQDSYYVFTTNYDGIIYYKNINSNIQSAKTLSFPITNTLINENMPLIYKFNWVTKDTEVDISPKIKMSLLEQQENFMKININFSTFNTDKYIYYYSTDRKNWVDILENDYKYTSYINGTLYVMILDKQEFIESVESGNIVYNPLSTATYTFSNINEVIPELKFNLNVSDSCKIRKNVEEIIVCKNLDIEIINYNSIDKYMWQYSFDRENWLNIYTNKFNVEFSENKTIYFKLLDKINNEELKYVTYTVTGISAIPGDIGAYIKMKGSYNKDSFSYEIDTYFYNYDSSLYNYYYSEDGINWNEISSYNMLATTNSSIKHIILKFYKDLTVYVKIENKNNEYVNAATYTITYFSNNDSLKDSLDLFSSKSYLTGQAFQNFNEIWNKFKSATGIYNYLLIVVLSSIVLLLIKSFRK